MAKLIWPIVVLILGIILIETIGDYLNKKNDIEIETNRANCIINAQKNNATVNCFEIQ